MRVCVTSFFETDVFATLSEAKQLATRWRMDYNHHRPHSALNYQTQTAFAGSCVVGLSRGTVRVKVYMRERNHSIDYGMTLISAGTDIGSRSQVRHN